MNSPFLYNMIMVGIAFCGGLSYPRWPSVVAAILALLLATMFCSDVDDPWVDTILNDEESK